MKYIKLINEGVIDLPEKTKTRWLFLGDEIYVTDIYGSKFIIPKTSILYFFDGDKK